ncbi:hypothetical protein HHL23_10635 [Chryseobacterium sp. RP-3-3]|uniref:Branched-chain amino acid:cation transporter, LIVCS family n=1 Tax=Chryseobacterium antibioticum TaxID=2728847 RepID=A0A7Y0AMV8_9FLAO|nr:hypothetical protein [Chryseobacterium antibioticum]NML70253.1 hypothetical protein [Chryseobacterium antibioticum]
MKDHEIVNIGKFIFGLCFALGNICLFGYLITRNDGFAAGGYMLLIFGTIINLLLVIGLLVYGIADRSKFKPCLKAISLIMINIPVAYIYALIGLSLISK